MKLKRIDAGWYETPDGRWSITLNENEGAGREWTAAPAEKFGRAQTFRSLTDARKALAKR